jgi:hypothetical protein
VQVLCGQLDGEPSMLGIETGAVIAAWGRLKLRDGAQAGGGKAAGV